MLTKQATTMQIAIPTLIKLLSHKLEMLCYITIAKWKEKSEGLILM